MQVGIITYGMNGILAIAASGMMAAATRLNASASNVANVSSSGPLPDASAASQASYPPAYAAQTVDQVDIAGGGTAATVTQASPGAVPAYDPSAPYADGNGMVASPNVDLATEFVQQMTARYTFAANAKVMQAASQMMGELLDITT